MQPFTNLTHSITSLFDQIYNSETYSIIYLHPEHLQLHTHTHSQNICYPFENSTSSAILCLECWVFYCPDKRKRLSLSLRKWKLCSFSCYLTKQYSRSHCQGQSPRAEQASGDFQITECTISSWEASSIVNTGLSLSYRSIQQY